MSEVLDLLSSELDENKICEIARHLDADESQTEAAIAAALPTLIIAMGRHSETEQGATMITQHMQGIGGGSLADLLGGLLGGQQRKKPTKSHFITTLGELPQLEFTHRFF